MECHLFRKIEWIELKTKDLGERGQLVRYENINMPHVKYVN